MLADPSSRVACPGRLGQEVECVGAGDCTATQRGCSPDPWLSPRVEPAMARYVGFSGSPGGEVVVWYGCGHLPQTRQTPGRGTRAKRPATKPRTRRCCHLPDISDLRRVLDKPSPWGYRGFAWYLVHERPVPWSGDVAGRLACLAR